MSRFTDRLYNHWRQANGGSGVLLTTGRPAVPGNLKQVVRPSRVVAGVSGVSGETPDVRAVSRDVPHARGAA